MTARVQPEALGLASGLRAQAQDEKMHERPDEPSVASDQVAESQESKPVWRGWSGGKAAPVTILQLREMLLPDPQGGPGLFIATKFRFSKTDDEQWAHKLAGRIASSGRDVQDYIDKHVDELEKTLKEVEVG